MTTKIRTKRTLALLAVLALLATGCRDAGGGGDEALEDTQADLTEEPADTGAPTEADTAIQTPDATDEEPAGATEEETDGEQAAAGDVEFDVGVTDQACPEAANPDNGCIYLGTISDLTVGPFAALANPITDAQAAFWSRVNADGGIGGFDVDVSEHVRDNEYNPERHNQEYQAIKGDVLALAQTLGSPTTAAIIDDMETDQIVGAPASWTSLWAFEDVVVESGINYCLEAMNQVDYAVENVDGGVGSVIAVGYPGDYGGDAAAGVAVAAEANGIEFTNIETGQGPDNQAGAISGIVQQQPDLVIVTTGPADAGAIVGQTAAQGYAGQFMFTGPSWNKGLLDSPAAPAVESLVLLSGPWPPYDADTPGHEAMREALGDVDPNEGYTSGWAWSYPLRAALEQAASNGDLTRAGLLEAIGQIESVDYEGMLPEGAGNLAGDPNEAVVRQSVIFRPDPEAATGATLVEDFFTGPTAESYELEGPCFTTTG